jgi:hypothetical protein
MKRREFYTLYGMPGGPISSKTDDYEGYAGNSITFQDVTTFEKPGPTETPGPTPSYGSIRPTQANVGPPDGLLGTALILLRVLPKRTVEIAH